VVAALAVLLASGLAILWLPGPPARVWPHYTMAVMPTDASSSAYEVVLPSVVYANGTVVRDLSRSVEGNGWFENTTTPLGPAILLHGRGRVIVRLTYDFSGVVDDSFRFPGGLPDLSQWTGPDPIPGDSDLGSVRVSITGLPPTESLVIGVALEYPDSDGIHLSFEHSFPNGQHDLRISNRFWEGSPPEEDYTPVFVLGGLSILAAIAMVAVVVRFIRGGR